MIKNVVQNRPVCDWFCYVSTLVTSIFIIWKHQKTIILPCFYHKRVPKNAEYQF